MRCTYTGTTPIEVAGHDGTTIEPGATVDLPDLIATGLNPELWDVERPKTSKRSSKPVPSETEPTS